MQNKSRKASEVDDNARRRTLAQIYFFILNWPDPPETKSAEPDSLDRETGSAGGEMMLNNGCSRASADSNYTTASGKDRLANNIIDYFIKTKTNKSKSANQNIYKLEK